MNIIDTRDEFWSRCHELSENKLVDAAERTSYYNSYLFRSVHLHFPHLDQSIIASRCK